MQLFQKPETYHCNDHSCRHSYHRGMFTSKFFSCGHEFIDRDDHHNTPNNGEDETRHSIGKKWHEDDCCQTCADDSAEPGKERPEKPFLMLAVALLIGADMAKPKGILWTAIAAAIANPGEYLSRQRQR